MTARRARRAQAAAAAQLKRLLDRLAAGAVIAKDEGGGFCLTDAGRTGAKSVDRDLVTACLAAELLKRTDRGLVLSDAGYARSGGTPLKLASRFALSINAGRGTSARSTVSSGRCS